MNDIIKCLVYTTDLYHTFNCTKVSHRNPHKQTRGSSVVELLSSAYQ